MSYTVDVARKAAKEIERLDAAMRERVFEAIRALRDDPRPDGCKKLRGLTDTWRIRVGDVRVIYEVTDKVRTVLVIQVGKRGDIY